MKVQKQIWIHILALACFFGVMGVVWSAPNPKEDPDSSEKASSEKETSEKTPDPDAEKKAAQADALTDTERRDAASTEKATEKSTKENDVSEKEAVKPTPKVKQSSEKRKFNSKSLLLPDGVGAYDKSGQ